MNSRSAKNDTSANSTHHAGACRRRTPARSPPPSPTRRGCATSRLSSTALGAWRARQRRVSAMTVATTSTAAIPANSSRVCACVDSCAISLARLATSVQPGRHARCLRGCGSSASSDTPRTLQEAVLVFIRLQPQRRAEGGGAQQRQRQPAALGHDPLEVVDPHRHELQLRALPGQVVDAALERQQRPRRGCACLRGTGSASRLRPRAWHRRRSGSRSRLAASRSISTPLNTAWIR